MNPRKAIALALCVIGLSAIRLCAQQPDSAAAPKFYDCCRPDGHAPLGVMTTHIHAKGQWSFLYSYMYMDMRGNRKGTSKLSDDDIFATYAMAGDKMSMQMHMLMIMYGISNRITVMGMLNYYQNNMSMSMLPMAMDMPGMTMASYNMPTSMKTSGLG
ncbi:MAG TPA: hypothetical protein VFU15_03630, partial [Bacteroidia bacterium]|nr:hypothetical protein [Bacteroidia bacterium]